jgi:transcriptional regulator with XRE-family HTH domain
MADHIDSRAVLWASVRALMVKEFGKENLSRFSARTGVPLGSLSRIKEQETSVGLEMIDRIAAAFGLYGWQLLVPGFDPATPPVLRAIKNGEVAMYEKLLAAARELVAAEPSPPTYTKGKP